MATDKRSQGSVALRDILGASAVRTLIGRKLRDDGKPISRDSLARFRQSETFPKPMQVPNVSDREPLWRRQDVNAWIDDQPPMRSWERGA